MQCYTLVLSWLDAGEHEPLRVAYVLSLSLFPSKPPLSSLFIRSSPGSLQGASADLFLASLSSAPSQTCPTSMPPQQCHVRPYCSAPWQRPPLLVRGHLPCPAQGSILPRCLWGCRPACCPRRAAPGLCKQIVWLANVELHGGQHWPQLHNSPLYVSQVLTPVQGAGHCRNWWTNQLIPGQQPLLLAPAMSC